MWKKLLVIALIMMASTVARAQSGTRNLRSTAYTRLLLQQSSESEVKSYLNLVVGTDFQAWDTDLDWLSANLTTYAKTLLDDTTASEARTTLELGNVSNVATSNTPYNATSWNNNTDAATKDAIRDKFEASVGDMTKAVYDALDNSLVDGDDTAYDAGTWDNNPDAASKNAIRDVINGLGGGHDPVTLGTASGLSLSTQELSLALATNASPGAASAAHITALEAATAHSSADGSSHTFINQNVTSTGDPTFNSAVLSTFLDLVPTASQAHSEGRLWYDSDVDTFIVYNAESDISGNVMEEMWVPVRNSTGSTITDGQVVYFSGATGGRPNIILAKADDAATALVAGIATHDIENNTNGYITTVGLIRGAINTVGLSGGDPLYLSAATDGLMTATPPTPPDFIILCARVMTVSANGDIMFSTERLDFTNGVVLSSLDTVGDLTIHGDDLFMATNTDKALLVADGTNFNPVVSTGDVIISNDGSSAIQANVVDDTHIDWGTGAGQVSAVDIVIADAGSIITATEVEGALQEHRTAIDLTESVATQAFNGKFLESIDFRVSEAAGTVTGSLEQTSGGDLTEYFSDGTTAYDTTPADTIDITAYVGTSSSPATVFIYILQSNKGVLVANASDWPAAEHIKVANLVLRTAVITGTDGALVNRNWNDHTAGTNSQGHIAHINQRIRKMNAAYDSGVALTLKNSGGTALNTSSSSTAVEIVTSEGMIYQMHNQTFPATDMYVTATDDAHITNQVTDEGGAYSTTTDLVTDITVHVDGTASGTAIGVNKYFNLVIWGIQNKTGEVSHIMINIPTGQYTSEAAATADTSGFAVYDIPEAYRGVGFLIARLTFRLIAGAQWTYIAQEDLRGQVPSVSAGVGVTTTAHDLLSNLDYASAGHTGFLADDGSTPLTANWDVGNFDITLNDLTGDGTVEGATLTEGGNPVYNGTETPGGELGNTWASPTIDDNIIDEANLKLETGPTNDFILTADSTKSGGMKWSAAGAGGGDVSVGTGAADNRVAVWEDGTTIGGAANFTHDGDIFTVLSGDSEGSTPDLFNFLAATSNNPRLTMGVSEERAIEMIWQNGDAIGLIWAGTGTFDLNFSNRIYIDATNGNIGIATTSAGTSAVNNLVIGAGTAPDDSVANTAAIWVQDASGAGTASLFGRSENGNVVDLINSGAGDNVSVNSGAVVDPDFVSDGGIDFTDTSNTITADLNSSSITGQADDPGFASGDFLLYSDTGDSGNLKKVNYDNLPSGSGDLWSDAVDSDILPTGNDNTYDLGSAAASFKDIFWDGTATGDVTGALTGNADTATLAATSTIVDSTDASSSILMVDSATGDLALKTDGGLAYNASTGMLSPTILSTANNIKAEPKHLTFNIWNPNGVQGDDAEVCIVPLTSAALTITNIKITLNASGNEVIGDLKFADTFIGLGTPTVINVCDTTSGVLDDSAMADGTIESGKCIYFSFDSQPNAAITQMCVDISYSYD